MKLRRKLVKENWILPSETVLVYLTLLLLVVVRINRVTWKLLTISYLLLFII